MNDHPSPSNGTPDTAGRRTRLLRPMRFAREMTLRLLEIPVDGLLHRPTPSANHALWIAGHLAYVDDWMQSTLAGSEPTLDDDWVACFGTGSVPSMDADPAEAIETIRAMMVEQRDAFERWLGGLGDAQLAAPLPQGWEAYGQSLVDVPAVMAWHEGIHAGQLTVIRRDLGLPDVMH